MDLSELKLLLSAEACDFAIEHVVGSGQNGLVVAARCTLAGLQDPGKLYAVKLLFNFTHEYSSVVRNVYENEWLLLSRLLPHDYVVRFWTQFVSTIPTTFIDLLPTDIKKVSLRRTPEGDHVPIKGQFLVLDYHPKDLKTWMSERSFPLTFEVVLTFSEELLEAVLYLESNRIRHLDLKLSNLLITESEDIVLCDFGQAVKFPDETFRIPYSYNMFPGGNRAHLAPEVLNEYHRCRQEYPSSAKIDYSMQASFAVGILICELSTGGHPLPDYPLAYMINGITQYGIDDLSPLPANYPKSFSSIVLDLLTFDPTKRLSIEEALNQLQVCCKRQNISTVTELTGTAADLKRICQERDLARAKLSAVGTERDFAVAEMKKMAEHCQTIVGEFQAMADHCELLLREIKQLRLDRDNAILSSESAFEASEMIRNQLTLVTRDRDLAKQQIEEMREISAKCQTEESILDCLMCHKFYLESQNTPTSCNWHSGKYLFNRWSCCYKVDERVTGCKMDKHTPRLVGDHTYDIVAS